MYFICTCLGSTAEGYLVDVSDNIFLELVLVYFISQRKSGKYVVISCLWQYIYCSNYFTSVTISGDEKDLLSYVGDEYVCFSKVYFVSMIIKLPKRDECPVLNFREDVSSGDFFRKIGKIEGVCVRCLRDTAV